MRPEELFGRLNSSISSLTQSSAKVRSVDIGGFKDIGPEVLRVDHLMRDYSINAYGRAALAERIAAIRARLA